MDLAKGMHWLGANSRIAEGHPCLYGKVVARWRSGNMWQPRSTWQVGLMRYMGPARPVEEWYIYVALVYEQHI